MPDHPDPLDHILTFDSDFCRDSPFQSIIQSWTLTISLSWYCSGSLALLIYGFGFPLERVDWASLYLNTKLCPISWYTKGGWFCMQKRPSFWSQLKLLSLFAKRRQLFTRLVIVSGRNSSFQSRPFSPAFCTVLTKNCTVSENYKM